MKRVTRFAVAFPIAVVVSAVAMSSQQRLAEPESCPARSPDVVCTELGAIRGVVDGSTLAFKGIPYARPPVGSLRWRPPEPAIPWQSIREGREYGPICPQIAGNAVTGDEDCLTLNIWRPREPPVRRLPVMIWLTGGGNHASSGRGVTGFGGVVYNGEQLVPQGIVFVSFNIRLGVLGFLAHPALSRERPEHISGNYGSLDQVAMLGWIRRNVAAFGGDPERVFLFGTSAGGGNICALISSPLTRGLIHAVAMQGSVPAGCEIQTLADIETGTGTKVTKAVGCDVSADVAACLRGKGVQELVSAIPGTFNMLARVYGPNVDGHVFPDQPIRLIAERKHAAMPIIIGNTSQETNGWVDATAGAVNDSASVSAAIDKVFGAPVRERILATYPKADAAPRAAFVQMTTDALFTCMSRRVARTLSSAQQEPVYRFYFDHPLENEPTFRAAGVGHTSESPFLFAWQGTYKPTPSDLAIQRNMTGYWTRMAKTGSPNGDADPAWEAVTPSNDAFLEIGATTVQSKRGSTAAHCDLWDSVSLPWPHL